MSAYYQRSNGKLVKIADMDPHHAAAAAALLRAEQPHRTGEIDLLQMHADNAGVKSPPERRRGRR
jgi:hypothetical protein